MNLSMFQNDETLGDAMQQVATFQGSVNVSPFTSEQMMNDSVFSALEQNGWGVQSVDFTISGGALTAIVNFTIRINVFCGDDSNVIASVLQSIVNNMNWSNRNAVVRFVGGSGCGQVAGNVGGSIQQDIYNGGDLATVTVSAGGWDTPAAQTKTNWTAVLLLVFGVLVIARR
jgi:hypothetical protein